MADEDQLGVYGEDLNPGGRLEELEAANGDLEARLVLLERIFMSMPPFGMPPWIKTSIEEAFKANDFYHPSTSMVRWMEDTSFYSFPPVVREVPHQSSISKRRQLEREELTASLTSYKELEDPGWEVLAPMLQKLQQKKEVLLDCDPSDLWADHLNLYMDGGKPTMSWEEDYVRGLGLAYDYEKNLQKKFRTWKQEDGEIRLEVTYWPADVNISKEEWEASGLASYVPHEDWLKIMEAGEEFDYLPNWLTEIFPKDGDIYDLTFYVAPAHKSLEDMLGPEEGKYLDVLTELWIQYRGKKYKIHVIEHED